MCDTSRHEAVMTKNGCFFETCYYALMGYPVDYFPDQKTQRTEHNLNGWVNFYVMKPILAEIKSKSVDFFHWVYIFITESQSQQNARKVFNIDLYDNYFQDDDTSIIFTDILHVISSLPFLKDEKSDRVTERLDLLSDCLLHILRLFICFPDDFMCNTESFDVQESIKVYSLIRNDVNKIRDMYDSPDTDCISLKQILNNSVLLINLSERINIILVKTLERIGVNTEFVHFKKLYTEHIKFLIEDKENKYLSFNPHIGPAQVLANGFSAKIHFRLNKDNVFNFFPNKDMQLCKKEIFILQENNKCFVVMPNDVVPRSSRKLEDSKPNSAQTFKTRILEESESAFVQNFRKQKEIWNLKKKESQEE